MSNSIHDRKREILQKCDMMFQQLCCSGDLEHAKSFLSEHPELNNLYHQKSHYNNIPHILYNICVEGKLDVAQWIYSLFGEFTDIKRDNCSLFERVCMENHLNIAQWLVSIDKTIVTQNVLSGGFWYACIHNNLVMAQWLCTLDIKPHDIIPNDTSISFSTHHTAKFNAEFISCCREKCDNLDLLKWLYSTGNVDIHDNNEQAFENAVEKNRIDVINWLYNLDGKIDIHVNRDMIFFTACTNGNLDVAKWLYSLDNKIDVHKVNEINCTDDWLFKACCQWGHLEVAKWIYSLGGDFHIHDNNNALFDECCSRGQLDSLKWLYTLDDKINIHADNDYFFHTACFSKQLDVAKWLYSLDKITHINFDDIETWIINNSPDIATWLSSVGLYKACVDDTTI